ncbi:DNA polymerase beta [Paracoccidioides lutzii Pb01]|uniref:DNA polymerase n=1 Tax=Paracoccidioides lutzii (strain ATCC MYA-826 / Pb01) TaxID=502779 RepID=C1HB28_PARBA|nr:DNA polymerase beta [Paracoccidioides lutzii Pb01]EEH37551.2 DNA polymerase beta [Paracoccidioides lutzii Pb01]
MANTGPRSTPSSSLSRTTKLDNLPSIFVLPTHLSLEELHVIEETLERCGAPLTYDISEAKLALGKVSQKRRAVFELRSRGLWTEKISPSTDAVGTSGESRAIKRRRVEGAKPDAYVQPAQEHTISNLNLESGEGNSVINEEGKTSLKKVLGPSKAQPAGLYMPELEDEVIVLKLSWLDESLKAGRAVPLAPYIIYRARKIAPPENITFPETVSNPASESATPRSTSKQRESSSKGILERAMADAASSSPTPIKSRLARRADNRPPIQNPPPKLVRETTEEHEAAEAPPRTPDWVRNNLIYACQRSAFLHPPNEAFINQLDKIKKIRELTLDEIGVRAYSTAIASIAAYPYPLKSATEVSSLPGCEVKIATLFSEFNQSGDGTLESANQLDTDPVLSVLNKFNNILGVGAKTAREFYYQHHWRTIDDIIEQGWNSLSRVQQIGIKYFDEFMDGIPRSEVESIADTVLRHAKLVRPESQVDYNGAAIEGIIVGGYRRGKECCGDVDLILTHRNERVTHYLVYDVVASLEQEGWITHTLALHLTNSHREQQTLPFRGDTGGMPHFDTLDKALVVWQDPHFEKDGNGDMDEETSNRNPNPHRRVDIIISPWRTIGCAIVGWTGGTTFERDLRRYAKKVHNWKFDSSGVRSRNKGSQVIDLEGKGKTWQERERFVLEGMGVGWRPPEERCTR